MSTEQDLFGADLSATRSFPPHLDPARALDYHIERDTDTDHVAPAVDGILPAGALGSNRDVWLAQVLDAASGAILYSESLPTRVAAVERLDQLHAARVANGQGTLF